MKLAIEEIRSGAIGLITSYAVNDAFQDEAVVDQGTE
jgi:hypothetical protein